MKIKRSLAFLFILTLIISSFGGCADSQSSSADSNVPATTTEPAATTTADASETAATTTQSGAIALKDMADREIALNEPATSIVALAAADCEILYALGAGDSLVGRGTYCNYPKEAESIDVVESGESMNVEQVMAKKPQVVIMSMMDHTTEQIKALEDAGTKVVISNAQSIEGVYQAIEMIGTLAGKDSEADKLIDGMKKTFDEIKAKSAGAEGKTVYFEVSPLEYGLWTAGKNTFMDEIASLLGLTNAFADVDGWGEISEEQVIERDPDYIVTVTMYFGDGPTPEEEIYGRAGWKDMKAIKNKGVFNADNDEITRPGPRLTNAAQALYDFVHANA